MQLDLADEAEIDAGVLNVNMPAIQHPSIPEDQRELWHVPGWIGILTAVAKGAWTVTDEWNQILQDHTFTNLEDFVRKCWGKE